MVVVLIIFITEQVVMVVISIITITIIPVKIIVLSSKYFQLGTYTLRMPTLKQMVVILVMVNLVTPNLRRVAKPFIYCLIHTIRSTQIDHYLQFIKLLRQLLLPQEELDLVILNHLLLSKTNLPIIKILQLAQH